MSNQLNDSGNRINYGDGMAIREPSSGKGRYELVSPYALNRLAKHCENGGNKYSSDIEINLAQVPHVLSEISHDKYGMNLRITHGSEYCCVFYDGNGEEIVEITSEDENNFYAACIQTLHAMHVDFPLFCDDNGGGNIVYKFHYDGGRNWEKGMPYSRYLDSAMRHLQQFLMGMENEDHLAAAAWNIFAIMHHQELGENNLDDLPHYEDRRGASCK